MCLRDPDLLGDLSLGHVAVEAQEHDLALALVQDPHALAEQQSVVAVGIRLGGARGLGAVVCVGQAERLTSQFGSECSLHLLCIRVDGIGELAQSRRAPEAGG